MTTWNKIEHTSLTTKDTIPGYGIWVDNEEFYVDNQNYYIDGAIVMRDNRHHLKCNNFPILVNSKQYDCNGLIITHDTTSTLLANNTVVFANTDFYWVDGTIRMIDSLAGYGIRCNDLVVLCKTLDYDCQGAIIHKDTEHESNTYNAIEYDCNGLILTQDTINTLLANNTVVFANTDFYWADGTIRMIDSLVGHGIRCNDKIILCQSFNYDCQGAIIYEDTKHPSVTTTDFIAGHGIRCDDLMILCKAFGYDCQGAIMYNEVNYGS